MSDNATLSEVLDQAKELTAVRDEANERLKGLRALAGHLVKAGMASDAQKKRTAELFPPVGRKPNKK